MSRPTSPVTVLAVLLLAFAASLVGGRAEAQAIGDPVETFLDAAGAAEVEGEDLHRIGSFDARVEAPDGVFARLELSGSLDADGTTDAARTLALATGYGAGIEGPLTSFLQDRAPELAGGDGVTVRLEEYELRVRVLGDAPPYDVVLELALPRVEEDAFGPPAATLGPEDAEVVVREFSDFQCPFCRRYAQEILPSLKASLLAEGDVRFEYHHFPLDSIHANATPAAEAAQCVADRFGGDAFWAYHDLLFERQAAWQGLGDVRPYFVRLAGELDPSLVSGPDGDAPAPGDAPAVARERVEACLEEGAVAEVVRAASERARAMGLTGTPTVFVGAYRVQDFGNPDAYARRIRLERADLPTGSRE